jgi:hypothetical protein
LWNRVRPHCPNRPDAIDAMSMPTRRQSDVAVLALVGSGEARASSLRAMIP